MRRLWGLWRFVTAPWTAPRCSNCGGMVAVEYLTPDGIVGTCCAALLYPEEVMRSGPIAYYPLGGPTLSWEFGRAGYGQSFNVRDAFLSGGESWYLYDDRRPRWWEYLVAGLVLAHSGRWR